MFHSTAADCYPVRDRATLYLTACRGQTGSTRALCHSCWFYPWLKTQRCCATRCFGSGSLEWTRSKISKSSVRCTSVEWVVTSDLRSQRDNSGSALTSDHSLSKPGKNINMAIYYRCTLRNVRILHFTHKWRTLTTQRRPGFKAIIRTNQTDKGSMKSCTLTFHIF